LTFDFEDRLVICFQLSKICYYSSSPALTADESFEYIVVVFRQLMMHNVLPGDGKALQIIKFDSKGFNMRVKSLGRGVSSSGLGFFIRFGV
jgi:hypothetical protein